MKAFLTRSPGETEDLGRSFASSLKGGDVVAVFGNLGTGKTRFINGVCQGLGVHRRATSPTFTIINEYDADALSVAHIDLYRVGSRNEILETGIEAYFRRDCICLIEWAERCLELLPSSCHSVKLSYGESENVREVEIGIIGESGSS